MKIINKICKHCNIIYELELNVEKKTDNASREYCNRCQTIIDTALSEVFRHDAPIRIIPEIDSFLDETCDASDGLLCD